MLETGSNQKSGGQSAGNNHWFFPIAKFDDKDNLFSEQPLRILAIEDLKDIADKIHLRSNEYLCVDFDIHIKQKWGVYTDNVIVNFVCSNEGLGTQNFADWLTNSANIYPEIEDVKYSYNIRKKYYISYADIYNPKLFLEILTGLRSSEVFDEKIPSYTICNNSSCMLSRVELIEL